MESAKPTVRPNVPNSTSRQPHMSIKAYLDLVDRLLDDKHFAPELKKPPRKSGL
jgi:hypothetical protein